MRNAPLETNRNSVRWLYLPGVHIAQLSLQFSVMYLWFDRQAPLLTSASQPCALLSQTYSENDIRKNYGLL